MSREASDNSHEAMRARLDELRRALGEGQKLPGLERLLDSLSGSEEAGSAARGAKYESNEDETMLAVIISAAYDGVDIARRYPAFFKRMLVDAELRAAFLDGLEAMDSGVNVADVLPLPPSEDLSFLNQNSRARRQRAQTPAFATSHWRLSARDIADLFSFLLPGFPSAPLVAEPAATYRSGDDFLEDDTVTLLRGRVAGAHFELDVTLEATRPAAHPGELHLALWVVPVDEAARHSQDITLLAQIKWGEYDEQVEISGDGLYTLPPRKLNDVVEQLDAAAGDLHIVLQHKR